MKIHTYKKWYYVLVFVYIFSWLDNQYKILIKRQYSIFLSDRYLTIVLEHSIRKFASRKFISNEIGVENRPTWWLFFRKSWNLVPDSKFKISTSIFRKLHSRFPEFLFLRKKLSDQIVVSFPVSTYYKSQCFKEFYDFILGHGLDSPRLNRMGLKKDMKNDNLFFKRVTDIIIPDYPLSIDM